MLMPKRVKYRREHRGKCAAGQRRYGSNIRRIRIAALKASGLQTVKSKAARIAMTRYMKRGGKVWIKIFPQAIYS